MVVVISLLGLLAIITTFSIHKTAVNKDRLEAQENLEADLRWHLDIGKYHLSALTLLQLEFEVRLQRVLVASTP